MDCFAPSQASSEAASENGTPSSKGGPTCSFEDSDAIFSKIGRRLLPLVALFYLFSFQDQISLGNAVVVGMSKDISLSSKQRSISIITTFIPYTLIQIPATMYMEKLGANRVLPALAMGWGVATMSQAFVSTFEWLLVSRFFLGLLTGPVSPGLVMYLSDFYPKQKLSFKIAIFFCMASIASATSGLFAFAIVNLDGTFHLRGWSWIFLIEGGVTMLFGFFSYFYLPASPAKCKFLTENQRNWLDAELKKLGTNGEVKTFSWRDFWLAILSPHVWMVALTFFCTGSLIDGLSYFVPTIVNELGYSPVKAQLYSTPPFALSTFLCLMCAYVSDSYNSRAPIVIFCCSLCILGFQTFLMAESFGAKYFSLMLSVPGAYCITPALSAWAANNSAPYTRRATSTSLDFVLSNMGGMTVAWLYGSVSHPPLYTLATSVLLGFSVTAVMLCLLNFFYLHWKNALKEIRKAVLVHPDFEEEGLGDNSAFIKYIY